MEYFTSPTSVVRKIWGKSDTVLFIFAGAAAEFALNKAVDWLYFTGKLPADPIGRLFSTVAYARQIVFAPEGEALRAIDKITAIHSAVEQNRGAKIPDWAYRDVLYMLIHYSIASYELLERKMTAEEKEAVYSVFKRVGDRMQLAGLPGNYKDWQTSRASHLHNDLAKGAFTTDLFKQYKIHLGRTRFFLLLEVQKMLVPPQVAALLGFRLPARLRPALSLYKMSRYTGFDRLLKAMLLPAKYRQQIKALDVK